MALFHFSEVLGNSQKLDGGAMFGNAPRAVWQKWIAPDEKGRIPLACRALLIEFENNKILFETGIGAFFEPSLAERYGVQTPQTHQLLESLKKLGLHHEDITHVVLSHLHFDHAGGLLPSFQELQKNPQALLFENAQFYTSKEAFQRAQSPHERDRASFIPDLADRLQKTGRLNLLSGSETLFEGHLEFTISHGHTPGQLLSLFHGNQRNLIFCGDLVPGTAWVHLPITMGYDRFAEMVIDEKRALYQSMDLDKTLFYFTHDTEIAAARIQSVDKRWTVVEKIKTPQREEF